MPISHRLTLHNLCFAGSASLQLELLFLTAVKQLDEVGKKYSSCWSQKTDKFFRYIMPESIFHFTNTAFFAVTRFSDSKAGMNPVIEVLSKIANVGIAKTGGVLEHSRTAKKASVGLSLRYLKMLCKRTIKFYATTFRIQDLMSLPLNHTLFNN